MRSPIDLIPNPKRLPIPMYPQTVRTVGLVPFVLLLGGTAILAKEPAPKLKASPLSLMLTKADTEPKRGNMFNPFQGGSPGGIQIVAKATSDKPIKGQLVPSEVEITSFTDDRGTNLLATKKERVRPGPFGGAFRSLEVSPQGDGDSFRLQIKSTRVPSSASTHLLIKGNLCFAADGAMKECSHPGLIMKPKKVIEVGTARVRFSRGGGFGGGRSDDSVWYVQILPGPEMLNPTILLFGDDKDIPVLNTANQSHVMTQSIRTGGKDPFDGITARGFRCDGGELSRVKIRFSNRSSLITVPFDLKVGLGDFTNPRPIN